ncbi:MAG: hypothetical protein ABEJ58_10400 [Halodesulfurarchaeum sp.]
MGTPVVDGNTDERVRSSSELQIIEPAIARDEVASTGRVGAIAYPYLVYEAVATMERPYLDARTREYVVSLDRSRRLPLRADQLPDTETRTVDDVLVLPSEVTPAQAAEMARKAVFTWTLRKYSLNEAPDISLSEPVDVYKVFWLVERPDGDVIVDSVRGEERPLEE